MTYITFEPILPFKFELCFDHLHRTCLDEFETGAFDLDHQDQIGLQTPTVLEKMNAFSFKFHSNLQTWNCELIIYWFQAGGGGRGLGAGGLDTCFFRMQKSPLLVFLLEDF